MHDLGNEDCFGNQTAQRNFYIGYFFEFVFFWNLAHINILQILE